jgi:hypothetical protein
MNLDAIAHQSRPEIQTMIIILSIWASPEKHLTLRGIIGAIEKRFPHRKLAKDNAWKVSGVFYHQSNSVLKICHQRSIRHKLSLKAMFVWEKREPLIKGHYWKIDISKGTGDTRTRKRKTGRRVATKAGRRDQAHARPYGMQSLHRAGNSADSRLYQVLPTQTEPPWILLVA